MSEIRTLNQRRWYNFRSNRRAYWSLLIFSILFGLSLFSEFLANDSPIMLSYRGTLYTPVISGPYEESTFGGDMGYLADFSDPAVHCLIRTGGIEACFDAPEETLQDAADGIFEGEAVEVGWIIWAPIRHSYRSVEKELVQAAPSPPDSRHLLGTDDQSRDVLARAIYGFRISVLFALCVGLASSVIGIAAGAVQGYFGGLTDLMFQRFIEIWQSLPILYVIIVIAAVISLNFTLLTFLVILFSWMGLVDVVRAEFLRARNFEYIRAARALGVRDRTIIVRHVLPNAMVATLTMLPFIITGAIGWLTTLDFLGFGLPPSYPSLGELALQGKNYPNKPWLGLTAFFTLAILLSLLVFIFEGVRDAFDPRKTFK